MKKYFKSMHFSSNFLFKSPINNIFQLNTNFKNHFISFVTNIFEDDVNEKKPC